MTHWWLIDCKWAGPLLDHVFDQPGREASLHPSRQARGAGVKQSVSQTNCAADPMGSRAIASETDVPIKCRRQGLDGYAYIAEP